VALSGGGVSKKNSNLGGGGGGGGGGRWGSVSVPVESEKIDSSLLSPVGEKNLIKDMEIQKGEISLKMREDSYTRQGSTTEGS